MGADLVVDSGGSSVDGVIPMGRASCRAASRRSRIDGLWEQKRLGGHHQRLVAPKRARSARELGFWLISTAPNLLWPIRVSSENINTGGRGTWRWMSVFLPARGVRRRPMRLPSREDPPTMVPLMRRASPECRHLGQESGHGT
jgi:hypothetical protein